MVLTFNKSIKIKKVSVFSSFYKNHSRKSEAASPSLTMSRRHVLRRNLRSRRPSRSNRTSRRLRMKRRCSCVRMSSGNIHSGTNLSSTQKNWQTLSDKNVMSRLLFGLVKDTNTLCNRCPERWLPPRRNLPRSSWSRETGATRLKGTR